MHNRFAMLAKPVLLMILACSTAAGAADIRGTVVDAATGDPLPVANLSVANTQLGAATDLDGYFTIRNVPRGAQTIVATYLGYEPLERAISVGTVNRRLSFRLEPLVFSANEVTVFADRAVERETPVAFTNVSKTKIQEELGSRDLPLVMDTTPSVYSTAQGGGAGDARVNVRGFNQRNVAIMINGVPVNDMENGWVYWSNWDGVGDATSSVQLQRGLSAVNLATPSIGGTLNIITDASSMRRGFQVKQEAGSGSFYKTTVTGSTGLINERFAFTLSGVRKIGDGVIDGTWTDAWAYYLASTFHINQRNRLELFAVGAPQRHGQNRYRQNIGAYSHEFARGLATYDPAALEEYPEADLGRKYNQNINSVSSSYKGQQAVDGDRFDRHDASFLNERENFYHKPQVNLNFYSQLTEDLLFSTVAYYSGGKGGGGSATGDITWDTSGPSPIADWDATVAVNQGTEDRRGRPKEAGVSKSILRNSRNNQWTIGTIAKLEYDHSEAVNLRAGIDWRIAEIEHFGEVRDLLGGNYYVDYSSQFWSVEERNRGLGDKLGWNYTNTVDWFGAFLQSEYTAPGFSSYVMTGVSTNKYSFNDHFSRADPTDVDSGELFVESDNLVGYQVKAGGLVQLNEAVDVFTNIGYISKIPIFDGVINDFTGALNSDPKNEEFISFELGSNHRTEMASVKLSVYFTQWNDRTKTQSVGIGDDRGLVSLTGLNALHQGFEAEVACKINDYMRLDGACSIGDWHHTDDATGNYRPDDRSEEPRQYDFYVDNLKVGDAPQTQFAYGLSVFPVAGMKVQGVGKTFANFYADFDPFDRTNPNDRTPSWEAPGYTVVDLHASYRLPLGHSRVDARVNLHVFNLFDELYIQDAVDNSSYVDFDGDHDADDAEVFMGLPRTINLGLTVSYF